MEKFTTEQLPELFAGVASMFAEKKEELCDMDAKMGDGDLGLTMDKGYGALPQLIKENTEPGDIGKTLMKAGMKMAGLVPSTMGTLMSSGVMEGGKALKGKTEFGAEELSVYLTAFAAGIKKRGKCELGDRTILDSVDAGAKSAAEAAAVGKTMEEVIEAACQGAAAGVEATKDMVPKFGKAAVFAAKAAGVADQGAVAGMYMIQGLKRGICG
ncbi:dihydroxyacetone kinase subunit L [Hominiventricola filiformis]|uniref:Dihydroxyacetone kinase subunit L n=1 Tax=Hominiventricola filiformis TaxID=2885352 RepID=A0AAE3A1W1_9FIRM|nr:dihydroxyacetone kinase subunit L [Hominiventricola filiformis]MCC2124606.1 dihydroxyacetone kinase subunit L [Hominiventricola filiformis]MCI6880370.1 dihydroxyacetone kinase subunit L [Clostridiaceae bacterium]RHU85902.1 DAK2 domain-containing protein [Clostridiaceae bacterium OM08-6BH]